MYATARDIESYFVGEKLYHMRHTSAGATPIRMNLAEYCGKMGRLVDAGALLKAIDGSGRVMRLPNITMAPDSSTTVDIAKYSTKSASTIEVHDSATSNGVITATLENNTISITAHKRGQATIIVTFADGQRQSMTVTVRLGGNNGGWL